MSTEYYINNLPKPRSTSSILENKSIKINKNKSTVKSLINLNSQDDFNKNQDLPEIFIQKNASTILTNRGTYLM